MKDIGEQWILGEKVSKESIQRNVDLESLENPVPSSFVREKLRTNTKHSS